MSITKEQQQALDDALVPQEQRLRIGNCNYRLSTTLKPKEPTFQVALDVLSLTPFYQAFLITASVPAIYMHEFWATVSFHKHCIKFKMNKKNYSFDLETFRDMLHICPNLPGQKFIDPPFEEEILVFIRELGYPGDIMSLSDVKVDTLYQPWRTFGTIINKCLSDLVYQIKNKVSKKNKDMYYPRFTKVIISHFMSKDQSIPRRNKVDWHMANDDPILTTMRFIPKHETVQKYGANEGTGVSPGVLNVPTYGSEDEQISWKSSDEDDDDEVSLSKDDDDNADNEDDDGQDDDNEQTESDNDGDDFVHPKFSTHNEEERQDEEDKEEEEELNEEETNKEEEVNELYRDVNVNLERRDTEMTDALQTNVQGTQVIEDTHVIITAITPEVQQPSFSISSGFISNMLNPNPNTCIDSILNLNTESTSLVDIPVTTNVEMPLSSFEDRVKALEDDFLEFKKTNLFAEAVSSIPGIVDKYLANQMNEAVKAVVQLQSDRLREEAQAENEDFINKIDENIKKIIKDQVKVQVKEQVTKILPRIEKSLNEQLEVEVLIRSSNEAKTSHVVAANLSKLELKKILIDKIENNKSIDRSVPQKNLYKALKGPNLIKRLPSQVLLKQSSQHYTVKDLGRTPYIGFNTDILKNQPVNENHQFPLLVLKPEKNLQLPVVNWNRLCRAAHRTNSTLGSAIWLGRRSLRNEDKLYTFKEGDYNKLHLQDIEDILLLLIQGKLTNLNVEERLALGVTLRMFTRSIILRRHVKDL
ncbi:hypothetical protein Tco_1314945 [Tanacetum coccineum]